MLYHFKIKKESKGYSAQCVELSGCITQADSLKELHINMQEVLNLLLAEPESGVVFPEPKKLVAGKSIVQVPVDPHIAFATRLRQLRAKRKLTQKKAADLLGIKTLYTYQKLEAAKTANPELKTLVKIQTVFPEFKVDEILSSHKSQEKKRA